MNTFTLKDYGTKTTFASFLPGVAGLKGIPIWCYYVNRGQGVVSFGVDNKDMPIMEFYPAHTAYLTVKRTGFRTFIKKEGKVFESFSDENLSHSMDVAMNTLSIEEDNKSEGLKTKVTYFVLPEERIGGLVRRVEITNTGEKPATLEILDGMPALIPYGITLETMKEMAQLAKAWMQVEEPDENLFYYRARASMVDTASVTEVEGGNYAFAIKDGGERLKCIVDPDAVFGYDNSLQKPVVFAEKSLSEIFEAGQKRANLLPSAFFVAEARLKPRESTVIYELIGQVDNYGILESFVKTRPIAPAFFEEKLNRAAELTEDLTRLALTKTGSREFDDYTRYTFMDNVLRGGLPVKIGKDKIFYVYSRKHGDLEREYNYFAMSPEFYSQGNGNYRDVNQNRRLDSFFVPFTEKTGIKMFYSLLQTDGYNPLSIEKLTYSIEDDKLEDIIKGVSFKESVRKAVKGKHFTPGQLALSCEDDEIFARIMDESVTDINASFGEGYWSDHWDYNLDMVEEYLSLYPDKEEELLYEKDYTYFASQVRINKRAKRYELLDGKVRQYHATDKESRKNEKAGFIKTASGETYKGTLMEKLVLMSTVKFAALDPEQMGVEMEGGKPGWYDALNGLPGILGSSMAETYELERMLEYTVKSLRKYDEDVVLFTEIADLLKDTIEILSKTTTPVEYWNLINDRKEAYWDEVYDSIKGDTVTIPSKELASMLDVLKTKVSEGIDKALKTGNGICPTYFYYDVTDYYTDDEGIHPTAFELKTVPDFLEGPSRFLKLERPIEEKRELYKTLKNSDLYDGKLKMYKVSGSLSGTSYELGRCRCFTPGWLENESIWLHMEYKYLLELIKAGMYAEFAEDLHHALIPFMDPEVYGRSILENSSFIASSANPDPKIHGKGFVARLSGSTVEFLNMWKIMMFGLKPFVVEDGELELKLSPMIPEYLLSEDLTVGAMFMGSTFVTYHFNARRNYFPGEYSAVRSVLTAKDGTVTELHSNVIKGENAYLARSGAFSSMDIYF